MMKKSIKNRIIVAMLIMVLIPLLICGSVAMLLSYNSAMNSTETDMREMAVLCSNHIQWELQTFKTIAVETGCNPTLSDTTVSNDQKKAILDVRVKENGFDSGDIIDANGKCIFEDEDYSGEAFFREAMNGKTYVSSPAVSSETGKLTAYISAPLWEGGIENSTVVGCVCFIPKEDFLNDIMRGVEFSEHSAAYIIDSNGDTIADVDTQLVKDGENIEDLAAKGHIRSGRLLYSCRISCKNEKRRNGLLRLHA